MSARMTLIALLLAGCTEYDLNAEKDDEIGGDDTFTDDLIGKLKCVAMTIGLICEDDDVLNFVAGYKPGKGGVGKRSPGKFLRESLTGLTDSTDEKLPSSTRMKSRVRR